MERSKIEKQTVIIIPAYNEAPTIGGLINDIRAQGIVADICVINDGSTDDTGTVAARKNVFVLNHLVNLGIGSTVETGCLFALRNGYRYLIRMDGDGQHPVRYYNDLLGPIISGAADIVTGSRFLGRSAVTSSFWRVVGIKIIAGILTVLTGRRITDPTSGYCAMNRKAFSFFSKRCADDYPEPMILTYSHFKFREIPITIERRAAGFSSITAWKSMYYMIKVVLSLIMTAGRKERI